MNAAQLTDWLTALNQDGYALANYLLSVVWQSSVLLVGVWGLTWLLRKHHAAVRHRLWLAALLLAPFLPPIAAAIQRAGAPQAPVTVLPVYRAPASPLIINEPREREIPPDEAVALLAPPVAAPAVTVAASPPLSLTDYPWALALATYLLGLACFAGWLALGRWRIGQWIKTAAPPADPRVAAAFRRARERLKLKTAAAVGESPIVPAPLTVGMLHPRVLLPTGLAQKLSDAELEAVALHESAHLQRRDPLVLALAALIRAALFFHPLVWLTVRRLSALAEHCADDAVLEATGEPAPYATLLARLAADLPPAPRAAELAAGIMLGKSAFLRRVEAVLADRAGIRRLSRAALTGAVFAAVLSAVAALLLPLGCKSDETAEAPPPKTPALTEAPRVAVAPTKTPPKSPQPPLPVLESPGKKVEGQRIIIPFRYPATTWKNVYKEDRWTCQVRVNGADFRSKMEFPPIEAKNRLANLDLTAGMMHDSKKPFELSPGVHRVALVFGNVEAIDPQAPGAPRHFDELITNAVEIEVVAEDSAEAQALRVGPEYDGKTLAEWLDELAAYNMNGTVQNAAAALARVGEPAVEPLMKLIETAGPRAYWAAETLGKMGETARPALPRLLEWADGKGAAAANAFEDGRGARWYAVNALSKMNWAAAEIVPVMQRTTNDAKVPNGLRQSALFALSNQGALAEPALRELIKVKDDELRRCAVDALGIALVNSGQISRREFYTQIIEQNPFDANVPRHLVQTKTSGKISNEKPHPLTQKMMALYRQRLKDDPSPEAAWNLARIIQIGLSNTQLRWSVGSDVGHGQPWRREDPAENFTTLATALKAGFAAAEKDSEPWRKLGVGLAKERLLAGDWDGMNAALAALGQEPIPAAERPWLTPPPQDWTNLRKDWQPADATVRSGDCALELRFEKDGKGLAGVHVQIKEPPPPSRSFRTGRILGELDSPYPLNDDYIGSFGSPGDRSKSRYAVSGPSGVVRFEKLPEMKVQLDVLFPTANFTEPGSNWSLLMETAPGKLQPMGRGRDPNLVAPHHEIAQVILQPGATVRYPKIVVPAQLGLNVEDWQRVDAQTFAPSWTAVAAAAEYEIALTVSAPQEMPDEPNMTPVLATATARVQQNSWPVGEKGVGGLRLAPGNIYLVEVKALDAGGTLLARLPRTRVWTPWPGVDTDPPVQGYKMEDQCPIHQEAYFRGSSTGPDGKEENLIQRTDRFLREKPRAFERPYARLGRAWLTWHHEDKAAGQKQLEQLAAELPAGNVARDTAAALLEQLKRGEKLPRGLEFVSAASN